jgi:hypothetical protein
VARRTGTIVAGLAPGRGGNPFFYHQESEMPVAGTWLVTILPVAPPQSLAWTLVPSLAIARALLW